jgi:hypothetical protein
MEDFRDKDQVSLAELLSPKSESSSRISNKAKSVLQVILASGFLHFYEGPWMIKNWDKSHICFYQARRQPIPDLKTPYISTRRRPLEEDDNNEDKRYYAHPYPGILRLGILLLEIELNRPIEEERQPGWPANIDADRIIARNWLSNWCENNSSIYFCTAVAACLDVNAFTDEFGRDCSFENQDFRQRIFEKIVEPLERGLSYWGISVEKVDDWTLQNITARKAHSQWERSVSQSNYSTLKASGESISQSAKLTSQSSGSYASIASLSISAPQDAYPNSNSLAAGIRQIDSSSARKVSTLTDLHGRNANITRRRDNGTVIFLFLSATKIFRISGNLPLPYSILDRLVTICLL